MRRPPADSWPSGWAWNCGGFPPPARNCNPLEGLWRWLKGKVLANRQLQPFTQTVAQALSALDELHPQDIVRITGVASGNFWMAT